MSQKVIGMTIKGETVFVRFTQSKVNIPPFGILTSDEAAKDPKVIMAILERDLPVFAEATEEEYKAYEAEQEKIKKDAEAQQAKEQEKTNPDFAKEVAARKSAENRVEALQKELAESKALVKELQEKVSSYQKEPAKGAKDKPKKE